MMSGDVPTLLDLMTMLPSLHPRHLASTAVASVRLLRLVSKDVGSLALTAVTSCEVHLGDGCLDPTPQQLVRLMAGAKLQRLLVNVTVRSGPRTPTAAQQLSICARQMECLLVNMEQAIKRVKKLSLCVQHITQTEDLSTDADMQGAGRLSSQDSRINTYPPGLRVVVGSMFSMLAAAVPNLHELRLGGSCWDAALSSFGICCPQLNSLDISIPCVHIEALRNFGTYLPGLLSVSVWNKSVDFFEEKQISKYMDDFLSMTGQCSNLNNLVIHFNADVRLSCKPDAWALVPPGLTHLTCNCRVGNEQPSFNQLIRRLPSLSLRDIPCDLSRVPQQFPLLQNLQVMSNHVSLSCSSEVDDEDGALKLDVLKQRFLSGDFSLTCPGLHLSGDCEDIHNVLTWLPPIPASVHLYLTLMGEGPPLFLEHIHRLFPYTKAVSMWGCWPLSEVWGIDVLRPLASLTYLYRLELTSPQLALTTSGLVQLCNWLAPCFKYLILYCDACQNVNVAALEAEVKKLGKEIHVYL